MVQNIVAALAAVAGAVIGAAIVDRFAPNFGIINRPAFNPAPPPQPATVRRDAMVAFDATNDVLELSQASMTGQV